MTILNGSLRTVHKDPERSLATKWEPALRPVSIAALLVARAQRLTLRHAQQENNEGRDDCELSYGS